jgi:hypothetical protein
MRAKRIQVENKRKGKYVNINFVPGSRKKVSRHVSKWGGRREKEEEGWKKWGVGWMRGEKGGGGRERVGVEDEVGGRKEEGGREEGGIEPSGKKKTKLDSSIKFQFSIFPWNPFKTFDTHSLVGTGTT